MKKFSLASFCIFFLCILWQQPSFAENLVNWGEKYINTKDKHLEILAHANEDDNYGQTILELLLHDVANDENICRFNIPVSKKNTLKVRHRFFNMSLSPDGKKLTVSKAPNAKIPKNDDCAKKLFGTYINLCPMLDTPPKTITITLKKLERGEVNTFIHYIHDGQEKMTIIDESVLSKDDYKRYIGQTIKAQYIISQYIDFDLEECTKDLFFIKFYDSNAPQ